MHLRHLLFPLTAAASLGLVACDTSPTPTGCDQPTLTAPSADVTLQARVTVAGDKASVDVALGTKDETTMGLLRLTSAQTLALYEPAAGSSDVGAVDETTKVPLVAPAEDCGVGTYTAEVPASTFVGAGHGLVVRLQEGSAFDARRALESGSATPHDTPAEVVVGQPFDVPLDRDLPSIVGGGWSQEWDLKLHGDCLVPASDEAYPVGPKDFAYAVDEDQQGSAQRATTDAKAHFSVPADVLAAGSDGCGVRATFVVLTTSSAGGAAVTIPGTTLVRVEAAPFTFQLHAALQ